ncbi:MAG: hypothetical protein JXA94_06300, partial [Parachlamydiales bacterium]|nr:hypothetical protein [Parachlamydiales bacterium]
MAAAAENRNGNLYDLHKIFPRIEGNFTDTIDLEEHPYSDAYVTGCCQNLIAKESASRILRQASLDQRICPLCRYPFSGRVIKNISSLNPIDPNPAANIFGFNTSDAQLTNIRLLHDNNQLRAALAEVNGNEEELIRLRAALERANTQLENSVNKQELKLKIIGIVHMLAISSIFVPFKVLSYFRYSVLGYYLYQSAKSYKRQEFEQASKNLFIAGCFMIPEIVNILPSATAQQSCKPIDGLMKSSNDLTKVFDSECKKTAINVLNINPKSITSVNTDATNFSKCWISLKPSSWENFKNSIITPIYLNTPVRVTTDFFKEYCWPRTVQKVDYWTITV